jgi:hypothetical protein
MKKLSTVVLIILTSVTTAYSQYFSQPESIIYDNYNNCYFVSNNNSGQIIKVTDTDTSFTGYEGRRGMFIVNNILYAVIDDNRIGGYDLTSDSTILNLTISDAGLLNDITLSTDSLLYITDFNGNKIYKYNPVSGSYDILVSDNLESPNGIVLDAENNRLVFVESYSGKIKAYSFTDSTVSTIVPNAFTGMDGITSDQFGNYYVSTWSTGSVYRYDKNFSDPPVRVSQNHNGPADIYFNQLTNTLAVPNFNSNSITFVNISFTPIKETSGTLNKDFHLFQNYPNPFNPKTTISFTIPEGNNVTLKVYNILGNEIKTLLNEYKNAGKYSVYFDASALSSGIYMYSLKAGDFTAVRKLVLVK